MLTSLLTNPWPAVVLLGVGAVLFAVLAINRQQRRYLAGSALCVVLTGVVLWAASAWVTPAEQVDALLDRLAIAGEQGDARTIVDALAATTGDEQRQRELARVIENTFERADFSSVRLRGQQISVEGDRATARFLAIVDGDYQGRAFNGVRVRLAVELVKLGEAWKIVDVKRYELVDAKKEMPIGVPRQ
ncbi:hypothetical protein Pan216_14480 [Planctomycetes bacterium Pan216]|uniref:SnoaL-like domain-containing protein n=1 Tax=Kolteria novifilia TaxID=2527975 RepID=A0A518B0U0_9BACT|nr:hypothetical protein Pan216_14480 [Planctomycetes bacterium Pan216]